VLDLDLRPCYIAFMNQREIELINERWEAHGIMSYRICKILAKRPEFKKRRITAEEIYDWVADNFPTHKLPEEENA